MKFDLIRPCKICPFRKDKGRITFQCRSRAEEIAEQAYRQGFPCHETAEINEDNDDYKSGGYYATPDSQMCGGFIAMKLKEQDPPPSFRDNEEGLDEEELFYELESKIDFLNLPVFKSEEEFLEANETDEERETREKEYELRTKRRKNMEHKERKAWLSGKVAASNDLPRISALDSNIEDLLDGLRVGESAAILNAWLEGYDAEVLKDQECN